MKDTLVIDLETKNSFADVGGEVNIKKLGISVAGVYSYNQNEFFALEEHELPRLEEMLKNTDHLIGFNINHFDIPVLEPYLSEVSLKGIAVTDMYEDAVNFLGHRVGLNALAKATLGESKSGHGLEALQWFKDGRVEDVKKYCLDDVRLTKNLYEHGKAKGFVLFESFTDGKTHSIPVSWGKVVRPLRHGSGQASSPQEVKHPITGIVEDAFNKKLRLSIEYVSAQNTDGLGYSKVRLVDIYGIKPREIEAYCHLRKSIRNFRLDRIIKAELTGETYLIPQDPQKTLF